MTINRPPRFTTRTHGVQQEEPMELDDFTVEDATPDDVSPFTGDPVPRAALRPPLRADNAAERARKRAAEIRGDIGGDLDEGPDDFYVDLKDVPEGWSYEWKRQTVAGAEDPAYAVSLRRLGWEPVPASRHPTYMPTNMKNGPIERKGMVLMERPLEITEEVRANELRKARAQIGQQKAKLKEPKAGQFERPDGLVKVSTSRTSGADPLAVPD